MFSSGFGAGTIWLAKRFAFGIHQHRTEKMYQRMRNKDMDLTVVSTDQARQGVTGNGVRYVLTFGLLGIIFASSMMLVIFAS
jgi:hypothetical protein